MKICVAISWTELSDIRDARPIESFHQFESGIVRLPGYIGISQVLDEAYRIGSHLGGQMLFPESLFCDMMNLGANYRFIQITQGVDILMQQHMKYIGLLELGPRFLDPLQRDLIQDYDIGSCGEEAAEESLRMVSQVGHAEHQTSPALASAVQYQ